jgi:hypothetical protein
MVYHWNTGPLDKGARPKADDTHYKYKQPLQAREFWINSLFFSISFSLTFYINYLKKCPLKVVIFTEDIYIYIYIYILSLEVIDL